MIGGSKSIAGRDRCASIASVSREGEGWPRRRQNSSVMAQKSSVHTPRSKHEDKELERGLES